MTINTNSYYTENTLTRNNLTEYYTQETLSAYNEMNNYLKYDLGIKAPIGGLNMLNNSLQNLWRSFSDVQETHLYNGILNGQISYYPGAHPRLSMVFAPETQTNFVSRYGSTLFQQYIPGLALTQLYNKPFMLSEFNHEFPCKGREDMGMMVAAVGAYNGWDILNRYAWGSFVSQTIDGTILGGTGGGATFTIANENLGIFSEI